MSWHTSAPSGPDTRRPPLENDETTGGAASPPPARLGGWTRGRLLGASAGGGAVLAGAALVGIAGGPGDSQAASKETDAEILNLFLLLERVQEAFYAHALRESRLDGDLREFASAAGGQETEHAEFLARRIGARARRPPEPEFGDSLSSPEQFRRRAIDLEEAAIAAYIGQSANLTRDAMGAVATLLSVEARQVAWIRDLAGVSPAPRAADPARKPADVLADLRRWGYVS